MLFCEAATICILSGYQVTCALLCDSFSFWSVRQRAHNSLNMALSVFMCLPCLYGVFCGWKIQLWRHITRTVVVWQWCSLLISISITSWKRCVAFHLSWFQFILNFLLLSNDIFYWNSKADVPDPIHNSWVWLWFMVSECMNACVVCTFLSPTLFHRPVVHIFVP